MTGQSANTAPAAALSKASPAGTARSGWRWGTRRPGRPTRLASRAAQHAERDQHVSDRQGRHKKRQWQIAANRRQQLMKHATSRQIFFCLVAFLIGFLGVVSIVFAEFSTLALSRAGALPRHSLRKLLRRSLPCSLGSRQRMAEACRWIAHVPADSQPSAYSFRTIIRVAASITLDTPTNGGKIASHKPCRGETDGHAPGPGREPSEATTPQWQRSFFRALKLGLLHRRARPRVRASDRHNFSHSASFDIRGRYSQLFDIIPLRYIFDGMDLGILVAFLVLGTLEAIKVFREDDNA